MKVYNIIEVLNSESGTKFACIKNTTGESIYSPCTVIEDKYGAKWLVDGMDERVNVLNSSSVNLEFVLFGGEE